MSDAIGTIERATAHLLAGASSDPDLAGAVSVDFLELTGLGIYAWLWARMVQADADATHNKADVARFFYAKLLPRTRTLLAGIESGADSVMALPEEAF